MRLSVWSSLVVALSMPSAQALACSPRSCTEARLWPPSGSSVPANMVTLAFTPGTDRSSSVDAGTITPRLFRIEGDARVSVPFTSVVLQYGGLSITPSESQPVGAQLVVEADASGCPGPDFRAQLTVSEPVPLPTALGTLSTEVKRSALQISVINGSCDALVDASYADLNVQLGAAALPYAALFRHQLYVDGAVGGGFSSSLGSGERLPQGQDRIYTICAKESWVRPSYDGLAPGKHRVRMKSQLPDGTTVETPEVDVELRCDGAPPSWPSDAGTPPSTRVDASVTVMSDASLINTPVLPSTDDDDGCALTSRRDGAWLLALALFLLRRRTR